MLRIRVPATLVAFAFLLGGLLALGSCGGDGGPSTPISPGGQLDPSFVALSIDGGPEITHMEASGMPATACDPRVDWYFYQVLLYENFTNGSGPNGYDFFFGFLFPLADSVGTYTVQGDELEAHFHSNGTRYLAHPNADETDGTVVVTRSDDRIDGTFSVTVVEYQGTTTLPITGRFSVDSGYSASCP
ncbi:MAG: hypothetical protein ACRDGR_06040 [bacterium]